MMMLKTNRVRPKYQSKKKRRNNHKLILRRLYNASRVSTLRLRRCIALHLRRKVP